jgi:glycosyltransferase involved in cell wall biosynthesis
METNKTKPKRAKLCFVVSSPMTAISFLNGHIDYLKEGFDITVVCNFDGTESGVSKNARLKNIKILRRISLLSDLSAVWALFRFQQKERFDIIHSVTPKAGLITAISGWLARTPIRIHWFTGQVWVLSQGIQRLALKSLDRVIAALNTYLLVDSPSQRNFLISEGVISPKKSTVLGNGSIAGVDTSRFKPNPEMRHDIREKLGITSPQVQVIIFVGRLNHDKGVDNLLRVFASGSLIGNPYLIVVGPDEEEYSSKFETVLRSKIREFRYIPYTPAPEKYLAAADIFCLPTLREGFGLSVIEASAAGLATVASQIYGVSDSVSNGETGLLFTPGNDHALATALNQLLASPTECKKMGLAGRKRAIELWGMNILESELERLYSYQLHKLDFGRLQP